MSGRAARVLSGGPPASLAAATAFGGGDSREAHGRAGPTFNVRPDRHRSGDGPDLRAGGRGAAADLLLG
jgi:hypothetical protein